jgi:hypothetical protein
VRKSKRKEEKIKKEAHTQTPTSPCTHPHNNNAQYPTSRACAPIGCDISCGALSFVKQTKKGEEV